MWGPQGGCEVVHEAVREVVRKTGAAGAWNKVVVSNGNSLNRNFNNETLITAKNSGKFYFAFICGSSFYFEIKN